jgi:hypothetical protein
MPVRWLRFALRMTLEGADANFCIGANKLKKLKTVAGKS